MNSPDPNDFTPRYPAIWVGPSRSARVLRRARRWARRPIVVHTLAVFIGVAALTFVVLWEAWG